ncbi:MAG TPA: copper chaperone PCu(A)C [Rhizomicrobium sp.]|nr:copper chaperone PCu(A)C [Rhizomicrobium sp.]
MMLKHAALSAAILCLMASPALAANVTVSEPWFRALPAGLPAGGYFVLHNSGNKDIVLTGVSSPACGSAMLHQSKNESGMQHMLHVDKLTVRAHGKITFAPGGYHVMCMKPTDAMKPGRKVVVTFEFSDGTKAAVPFRVFGAKGRP